ncbi:MAG TPA: response regulator transcription factor [Stackebrandtia sp.]|jgi:DNA-binding NarL/FixJ family response regulator|uniref:response regulator transcription factor n=1 Tax=Stackebrandtia sp. TaxID=2023065 RepID=UPI002D5A52F4|nr:response regulator transcription factor [Stackebrandtia sp.]HZE39327.1 response regulator transcription factor [Stackebrandtia sp.]
MTSDKPIRVLLADDQELVREGIRLILQHADDIEVVAEASDGAEAVELAARHRVDVALFDIQMPGMDGIRAAQRVGELKPSMRVIILTTFGDDRNVAAALRAGAAGFLLKDSAPGELIRAVRVVHDGHAILSPEVTRTLIEHGWNFGGASAERAKARVAELSDREHEILVLLGSGMSNADIAKRLFLGEGTVKAHVSRMLTKLDCANRVQAAIIAHDAGMLRDE